MTQLPLLLIRAAPKHTLLRSCRRVAGRRYPTSDRAFHKQSFLQSRHDDSSNTSPAEGSRTASSPDSPPSESTASPPGEVARPRNTDGEEEPSKPSESRVHGSAKKRSTRNRPEVRIEVPAWFLEENVNEHTQASKVFVKARYYPSLGPEEDLARIASDETIAAAPKTKEESLEVPAEESPAEESPAEGSPAEESPRGPAGGPDPGTPTKNDATLGGTGYNIEKRLLLEIEFSVLSGLRLNSNYSGNEKPHLVLQSPQEGAENFLDAVVRQVAQNRELDVISINAQDIAKIANDNADLLPDSVLGPLRSLAFDTHIVPDESVHAGADEGESNEEGPDENDESREGQWRSSDFSIPLGASQTMPKSPDFSKILRRMFPDIKSVKVVSSVPFSQGFGSTFSSQSNTNVASDVSKQYIEQSRYPDREIFISLIDHYLDGVRLKRTRLKDDTSAAGDQNTNGEARALDTSLSENRARGLIVHIQDYLEIKSTGIGGSLLHTIHEAISRRRGLGMPITIVGTTSSSDLFPSISEAGFASLQNNSDYAEYRTIVTPCISFNAPKLLRKDSATRNHRINLRNIQACINQLVPAPQHISLDLLSNNLNFVPRSEDLSDSVWTADKILRLVSVALGINSSHKIDLSLAFNRSWELIDSSDRDKVVWLELNKASIRRDGGIGSQNPDKKSSQSAKPRDKMSTLQKHCNSYERKLLGGVINAKNIKTTFADVRAPPATVEALKTLTTLSLIRPDAFKYGVLATDKIPGLLLYGPPGTGKTLLAKAVAKESKATVLEISGSDIYDKYVGEGEKNVRAIFSLAKKLSPCIVFIDEADAIFQSRGGARNRTSHRELINQFLREWDGMENMSAFIMVATNRPFDLDDAVLRRLPRRLLVDLPTEKDRESILGIHLNDEVLDASVSLPEIAATTPFYSGSDLKNLCVAAALACVREETENSTKSNGDEKAKYPEKRTLTKEHFDKAMQEISASISEDMGTLTAIRKFDEQYGDRRGRRKKNSGWGFGTMSEKEREKRREEDARVRTAEAVAVD